MTDMPGLHINTGTNLPNTEALPPLEAQTGFTEEVYPEFCREEKMKEKEVWTKFRYQFISITCYSLT